MLDIAYIRENPEKVTRASELKNRPIDVQKILACDTSYRALLTEINMLRQTRNALAKSGKNQDGIEQGKKIKQELKDKESLLTQAKNELDALLLRTVNIPYDEVPEGKSEENNIELKKVGTPPVFRFAPKSHIDLIKQHDLADLERGVKVGGFRSYFLKNQLAMLHMAVLWYVFKKVTEKGYTPLIAPALVKGFTLVGNGQFPWGNEEVYHLEKDDIYLAGTAEVPVTSYFSGEVIERSNLPQKFVAFSPCFRREAGSYGKDTKGLYRVHEFWKVEQVIIGEANDNLARQYHEELQENTEEILHDLSLSYRVLLMCTGDMGEPQAKKYDTEVWMPYKRGYGEIASNSIMTDFQAPRLNIRYRDKEGTKHCYTLNDTAIPSPRILIAILENFQQEDGSILIPKVLQPLCGFDKIG